MGSLDKMLASVRFRTVCPGCGHVGHARWTCDLNVAKCGACGERFDPYEHTFRPVTGGMTEDERRARASRMSVERQRERYRSDPAYRADVLEKNRLYKRTDAAWEKRKRYDQRYRELHRDEIAARRAARMADPEYRELVREYNRAYYAEHREEILMSQKKSRVRRKLAERGR